MNLELNEYERVICEGIVDPKTLSVTFDQIGGLEDQKKEVSGEGEDWCGWDGGVGMVTTPPSTTHIATPPY